MSAGSEREILRRLVETGGSNDNLTLADMDLSAQTASDTGIVAEYQARQPLELREDRPIDAHLVAHETKTTDGTADNQETFNLAHDIVDADSVPNDLILYEDGVGRVEPDSVDYGADSFDYTSSNTDAGLDVYYVSGEQALVEVRKVAPSGKHRDRLKEFDQGFANRRDQVKDPLSFGFDDPVVGLIPTDWTLEVRLDAPYAVEWDHDDDGSIEATNALLDIPIARANSDVAGLEDVVVNHI